MPRPLPITQAPRRKAKGRGMPPKNSRRGGDAQGPSVEDQVAKIEERRRARKRRRNNEPLIPGGLTTRGEFFAGEKAAENAQFRPQEQQITEQANSIPSWYQDYLAKLQGLQQQTVEQYQGLQKQAASLETPINEATMVGGTTPEAVAANNARANIIKAIQGSLVTQQGSQLNKLGQYGAIATQRKTQKEDEVSKARKDLAAQRGEFRSKYVVEGKQREFENTLAAKQFNLKSLETESALSKKNETTYDKEFSKQAAKYGYSPKDWRSLGSKGRAKAISDADRAGGKSPESLSRIQAKEQIKIAAKNGYTLDQWRKLSPQQRAAIVRKDSGKGTKGDDGSELSFRTGEQRGKAASEAANAKNFATALRQGAGIKGINAKGHKRSRSEAAKIMLADPKSPEPVLVSAALDSIYIGFISRNTAKRLHSANLKVQEIAEALGVPTFTEWSKKNQTRGNRQKRPS